MGVVPDVRFEYMTKANRISKGKPYVERFTKLIVSQIGPRSSQQGKVPARPHINRLQQLILAFLVPILYQLEPS